MWKSSIEQTDPNYFDEQYKARDEKWLEENNNPERIKTVIDMMGITDWSGVSVLDLGGGITLTKALADLAREHWIVDYSKDACDLAKKIAPNCHVVWDDAFSFLRSNSKRFDITLALGILEYAKSDGLETLFSNCPSTSLLLYVPVVEAYILHAPRSVVYHRNEIEEVRKKYGWVLDKDLPQKEHVFTRYKRLLR